ncbi:hypothetical protein PSHT_12522 [Puccinia striiformis]|uniref:Retrotransposon Copia-like N-terminal domain-containing protein n=1 Tax=Puccinia striiformis TaxID=27350 RepID=A0A2S4UWF8_9BASI|nr:hypothetical protein PSHT_12522 [Puccinia striiformis]
MASPKDNEREFTMEKLSGPDNFWSWRRNMLMVLTYHDLDDLVLVVDPPISQDDIEVKKKRAAALIRLHLDAQHSYQFVDDLDKFEAKELWDAISNHYASPTLKNPSLIERLHAIRFDKVTSKTRSENFETSSNFLSRCLGLSLTRRLWSFVTLS